MKKVVTDNGDEAANKIIAGERKVDIVCRESLSVAELDVSRERGLESCPSCPETVAASGA